MKREYKTISSTVDMTFVRPQTVETTQRQDDVAAPKAAVQMPVLTPRTRSGVPYRYCDRSVGFYKSTHNDLAEAQAILSDAQQQLVHG